MMVLDVTFDSPKKGDMTYVGDNKKKEEEAVKSAFVEFGEENKYGDGKVAYRVRKKAIKTRLILLTTVTEYLGYGMAAIGIVLLIAGTFISAGALRACRGGRHWRGGNRIGHICRRGSGHTGG